MEFASSEPSFAQRNVPPGPAREVKIPKAGNRGFRTLTLRNVIDRAKAVTEAMVPHLENLLTGSHGFRPVQQRY